uniref:Uncharacterized protein n=1 Tax=Rhizophora mucronata TaxID=61149 RepID=A0A2P2N3P6_RHIMU
MYFKFSPSQPKKIEFLLDMFFCGFDCSYHAYDKRFMRAGGMTKASHRFPYYQIPLPALKQGQQY